MKKIITMFVIFAFINLIAGCYTYDMVQVPELEQTIVEDDIIIITKDGREYRFSVEDYYVENDTLYSNLFGQEQIALTDISKVESVWLNFGKSGLLFAAYVVGAALGIALLAVIILLGAKE